MRREGAETTKDVTFETVGVLDLSPRPQDILGNRLFVLSSYEVVQSVTIDGIFSVVQRSTSFSFCCCELKACTTHKICFRIQPVTKKKNIITHL